MPPEGIKKAVLKLPSLLQYSIEKNLRPKVTFFKEQLGFSSASLTAVVTSNPAVLGNSLNKTIQTFEGLSDRIGLSQEEVCDMLTTVPVLLMLNWKTNLEPKIEFLKNRLGLSPKALAKLLKQMPRLLVHSVSTSLEPKLQMLEEAALDKQVVKEVVIDNPSLLLYSNAALGKRLEAFKARGSGIGFVDMFQAQRVDGKDSKATNAVKKTQQQQRRRRRPVLEVVDGVVSQTLSDVGAAALAAGTSQSYMYTIIRTARSYKGKKYVFETNPEATPLPMSTIMATLNKTVETDGVTNTTDDSKKEFLRNFQMNYIPEETNLNLVGTLQSSKALEGSGMQASTNDTNTLYLAAFVSGRAYPPDNAKKIRGGRCAGGLSMFFPQFRGCHAGGKLLRSASERCFTSQIMPNAGNGTRYCDGLVLVGYPYLRPSRNRCSLYGCRDALRLILVLLSREALRYPEIQRYNVEIDIFTDSNYAWEMVRNSTTLEHWGSYNRSDDFVYDGNVPKWMANVDILYPLARTYYRLIHQDPLPTKASGKVPESLAKDIRVNFHHTSKVWTWKNDIYPTIGLNAARAARWQYERVLKPFEAF